MPQYITATMIENEGDYMHAIEVDTEVIKPDLCVRVGVFSMHLTAARALALADAIYLHAGPAIQTPPSVSEVSAIQEAREEAEETGDGR